MMQLTLAIVVILMVACSNAWKAMPAPSRLMRACSQKQAITHGLYMQMQRDAMGYEIKPRDWFNGLSTDPGASLTDPRAVPPECKQFAEDVKTNKIQPSLKESLTLVDKHYDYFEVPFSCAGVENKANENTAAAKLLSFALMTKMNEEQTLRLFGEAVNSDANAIAFKKLGWSKVNFSSGLAIVSKLQAYDDTDSALATQATIEGSTGWDVNSDSWIP